MTIESYLEPTHFIDSNHDAIEKKALDITKDLETDIDKAVALYNFVREEISYSVDHITLEEEPFIASNTLERGYGHCIDKTVLLAALARAVGIEAGLGFAVVQNHQCPTDFKEFLQSDLMVPHAYVFLKINNKWVKCTPSFDSRVYEKYGMEPLEFNGMEDSMFPAENERGPFMEYIKFYNTKPMPDLDMGFVAKEFKKYYPHFFEEGGRFS